MVLTLSTNFICSRYEELTFPDKKLYAENSLTKIEFLDVTIEDLDQPLTMNSNETYTLKIKAPAATLQAESVWGALRGKFYIINDNILILLNSS